MFRRHRPKPVAIIAPPYVPPPAPAPAATPSARSTTTTVQTGNVYDGVRWQGTGPGGTLICLAGTGIQGATLTHLAMADCEYAAKFGGGAQSYRLHLADWLVERAYQGLYLGCVNEAVVERLVVHLADCDKALHGWAPHGVYQERACHMNTFREVTILGGRYFAFQGYMDSTATADRSTDLTIEGLALGAPGAPVYPLVLYRHDRVRGTGVKAWGRSGEACVKLVDCRDVDIEIEAWGGDRPYEIDASCAACRVHGFWNGKAI